MLFGSAQQLRISDGREIDGFVVRRMLLQLNHQTAAIRHRFFTGQRDRGAFAKAGEDAIGFHLRFCNFVALFVAQFGRNAGAKLSNFLEDLRVGFFFCHFLSLFGIRLFFGFSISFFLRGFLFRVGFSFRLFRFFVFCVSLFFLGGLFGVSLGFRFLLFVGLSQTRIDRLINQRYDFFLVHLFSLFRNGIRFNTGRGKELVPHALFTNCNVVEQLGGWLHQ
ncbi:hypothetical protein MTE1_5055 [Klebsiella pneumoniae JHCK1]|nr:hypothetical protein MTE1_5055 [Klebsiella pneumoniae JHCK1]